MSKYPLYPVMPHELRQMFNEGRYYERVKAGEFTQKVLKNRHPALPVANEPVCTRSQIIAYHDNSGNRIALVHQYLRRDGSLGASGQPDPKRLLSNGILYVVLEP